MHEAESALAVCCTSLRYYFNNERKQPGNTHCFRRITTPEEIVSVTLQSDSTATQGDGSVHRANDGDDRATF